MTFFKTLADSLVGTLRKTNVYDTDVIRQNTPPDERDIQAAEEVSAPVAQSYVADRGVKLSGLKILAPVILGILEILPSVECDILLSSF